MKIIFKVLRNHSRQGIPSVFLQVDNEKYMFNVPETTQRFIREHGLRFSKGMNFFFTGLTTNHLMGIVGLSLTLFQNQLSHASKIYGPKGICKFFKDLRYMTGIKLCHFSIASLEDSIEEKNCIAAAGEESFNEWLASPSAFEIFSKWDEWTHSGKAEESKLIKADKRLGISEILGKEGSFKCGTRVYSDELVEIIFIKIEKKANVFVVVPKPIRGNIIPEKLKQFGIKGKMIRELELAGVLKVPGEGGKEITVRIEEVTEKSPMSPCLMMIDAQDELEGDDLQKNETLRTLLGNEGMEEGKRHFVLTDVVHFANSSVVLKPGYVKWMRSLDANIRHVFPHESFDGLSQDLNMKFLLEPKDIPADCNFNRYQTYVNSLNKNFPDFFPKVEPQSQNKLDENIKKCRELLQGLKCVEVDITLTLVHQISRVHYDARKEARNKHGRHQEPQRRCSNR